ncbi:MAG: MGMT family protein [Acidilobus sp.]
MDRRSTFREVYKVVMRVPRGKVTTYAAIARRLGLHPRVVAMALRENPLPLLIPCHRVIRSDGTLGGYSFGGPKVKRALLELEGVKVDERGRVPREYIIDDLSELL